MIELPKYSVPTYDPRGLAVNERTDFTRRIPALTEKQLARDAKIVSQIIRAYEAGDNEAVPDQFPWPQPQALTRTIADVLDEDVPDTFFLKPESVISFLTRNEQGDRCLYRVSDHLPTPDEVRQWVREMEDEGKSEVRTPADHHTKQSLQHIAQRLSPTDEVEKWVENAKE